jgi:hypothetical protein
MKRQTHLNLLIIRECTPICGHLLAFDFTTVINYPCEYLTDEKSASASQQMGGMLPHIRDRFFLPAM